MANPPRVKGTRAESAAARWLTGELGIEVTRGPLRGNQDRGDLFGVPDWTIEVKNCKTANPKIWARELDVETRNNGTGYGVILWSPPGVGMNNVDKWVAFTFSGVGRPLIRQYGPTSTLHRFVAHVDNARMAVIVGDAFIACLASTWLYDLRERIPAA